jgi:hypothetical protein
MAVEGSDNVLLKAGNVLNLEAVSGESIIMLRCMEKC